MEQGPHDHQQMSPGMVRRQYMMFGLNMILSFVIMYVAMFSMIWSANEFFNNLNMAYMALIMLAPMAILMLLMMRMMFRNSRLNTILYAASALVFALSFWAMRAQAAVGDRQFLRAMIPHHAGAVLMCRRASIHDPELRELCFKPNGIVDSQTREIGEMEAMLKRL